MAVVSKLSLNTNEDLSFFFRSFAPLGSNVMAPSANLPGNSSIAGVSSATTISAGSGGSSKFHPRESQNLNILRATLGDPEKTDSKKRKGTRGMGLHFTVKKYTRDFEPTTLTMNAVWYNNVPHMHIYPNESDSQEKYVSARVNYFL